MIEEVVDVDAVDDEVFEVEVEVEVEDQVEVDFGLLEVLVEDQVLDGGVQVDVGATHFEVVIGATHVLVGATHTDVFLVVVGAGAGAGAASEKSHVPYIIPTDAGAKYWNSPSVRSRPP